MVKPRNDIVLKGILSFLMALFFLSHVNAEESKGIVLPEHETLEYQVEWLGIPVGRVVASIKGIKKINGRDAYEIEGIARTNDFCSHIYKIEDRFVTYIDKKELYTLRHEVYRREGRYKKDAMTIFDQVRHMAHFKSYTDKSEKNFEIPPRVQDSLSIAYFLRTLPVVTNKTIEYTVSNTEANYDVFTVIEDKKLVDLPHLGKKEAYFFQPYAKFKGKIERKGRASGYFSADDKKIPLYIIVEAPLFTKITAHLVKAG